MQRGVDVLKKYFNLLKSTVLFKDINDTELGELLKCLNAKTKEFKKNEIIFFADSEITSVGIILSGTVQILKEDISGNRTIVAELSKGELFGETFACAGIKKSPISVMTVVDCEILFVDYKRIITNCTSFIL